MMWKDIEISYIETPEEGLIKDVTLEFDADLSSKDLAEIRQALYDIMVYCVGKVFFNTYEAGMMQSSFANRIGLYPLVQSEDMNGITGSLSGIGPGYLTTDNIIGLHYTATYPICYLKKGEKIRCKLFVDEYGSAAEHEKFAAVSAIRYEKSEGKTLIYFTNNGCYETEKIIDLLLEDSDEYSDDEL